MDVLNNLDNLRKQFNLSSDDAIAWAIINQYFSFFRCEDAQEQLWLLKIYAVISNDIDFSEKAKDYISFFTEYTTLLLRAVHRLQGSRDE